MIYSIRVQSTNTDLPATGTYTKSGTTVAITESSVTYGYRHSPFN